MISVVCPLLGLLGTVCGMLNVFKGIEQTSLQAQQMLASGVSSALISTVLGLSVAVPTMLIYYFLSLRMKRFYIESIEHSYKAISVCKHNVTLGK